jgi:hypothetical protein
MATIWAFIKCGKEQNGIAAMVVNTFMFGQAPSGNINGIAATIIGLPGSITKNFWVIKVTPPTIIHFKYFAMKRTLFVLLILTILNPFYSCSKKKDSKPRTIVIQNIVIDSCFQVSNPISYLVNIANSTITYQTTVYDIPFSNTEFFPSGIWTNLNYEFDCNSSITFKIYFKLPSNNQIFEEAYGTFILNPTDYQSGSNADLSTIIFIGNPGPNQTKLTLSILWK